MISVFLTVKGIINYDIYGSAPSLDSFINLLTDQMNIKDLVQSSHYYS